MPADDGGGVPGPTRTSGTSWFRVGQRGRVLTALDVHLVPPGAVPEGGAVQVPQSVKRHEVSVIIRRPWDSHHGVAVRVGVGRVGWMMVHRRDAHAPASDASGGQAHEAVAVDDPA